MPDIFSAQKYPPKILDLKKSFILKFAFAFASVFGVFSVSAAFTNQNKMALPRQ
jgi:hypothetical protein